MKENESFLPANIHSSRIQENFRIEMFELIDALLLLDYFVYPLSSASSCCYCCFHRCPCYCFYSCYCCCYLRYCYLDAESLSVIVVFSAAVTFVLDAAAAAAVIEMPSAAV